MVTNVTSLTGNGLKDWLIQRVSAVYFLVYVIFIIAYLAAHPGMPYEIWHGLFSHLVFKVATVIAILSFILHTWIGVWTVTTDYIPLTFIRLTLQMLIALALLGQFIWCVMILWGQ